MLGRAFSAAALQVTATVNEMMRYSRDWYVHSMWPAKDSLDGQSSAVGLERRHEDRYR
jgi:hypothetical protein